MRRAVAARLAVLESAYWLTYLENVYAQALAQAASEARVPPVTVNAMLAALRHGYQAYGAPPVGWERDVPRATTVANALLTMLLPILRQYLDWPVGCAVRKTMHDLLLAVTQTVHGPS